MINILEMVGRKYALFLGDLDRNDRMIKDIVSSNRFLVIGGAGSIGQAVVKEIFKRNPRVLHVVDISENNLVELVRDIRSALGYIEGDFRTFAIDCSSLEFDALMKWSGGYDYVLNLSALKHVRSEKDPFTLMRMVEVNILNTIQTLAVAKSYGASKYFCVSTDKAANPVNMMGASKRIMEMYLMRSSLDLPISTARFANVAFSDGSLLHGFSQRFLKQQPIAAPNDVRRYFLSPQESGELCLMSCLLGENRDIFFPILDESHHLISFSDIATYYLNSMGYRTFECDSEEEALKLAPELIAKKQWPCFFSGSDTTGEKDIEEFYTLDEQLDMESYSGIGVIKNHAEFDENKLNYFIEAIDSMRKKSNWNKAEMVELFKYMIPDFYHTETGKYLDEKM